MSFLQSLFLAGDSLVAAARLRIFKSRVWTARANQRAEGLPKDARPE